MLKDHALDHSHKHDFCPTNVIPCHLVNDSAAANNLGTVAKSLHSLNPCLETFKTWDYILELIRHYLSMYYIMIFIIGMVINIMTLYDKIFEEYNVGKLEREKMKNLDNSRKSSTGSRYGANNANQIHRLSTFGSSRGRDDSKAGINLSLTDSVTQPNFDVRPASDDIEPPMTNGH